MKKFLSISVLIITVVCLLGTVSPVLAVEKPTKLFYADDFADVLSDDTERFITEHSAALEEATGAQIVAVTVESLDGQEVMDYGLDILRSWQVGSEKDNGVVILVSVNDRKIGVNIGYGLEGALNDSQVGRLIDTCAIDQLKENDYDTGIYRLYNAVLAEVYREYGMEVPDAVKALEDYEDESDDGVEMAVIAAVMLIVVLLSFINRRKGGPPTDDRSSSGRRGFYGGYFGGSTHGGGTHGSSFGGFRGGGGSGGGGGASRGF